ncbi:hypothetical protein KUCAC02_029754, partial [Chaenocephalus aceratus]
SRSFHSQKMSLGSDPRCSAPEILIDVGLGSGSMQADGEEDGVGLWGEGEMVDRSCRDID